MGVDIWSFRHLCLRSNRRAHLARVQVKDWFANGKGIYVTAFLPSGTTLFSVRLDGNVIVLQKGHNWLAAWERQLSHLDCPLRFEEGALFKRSMPERRMQVNAFYFCEFIAAWERQLSHLDCPLRFEPRCLRVFQWLS
jgi:hypothetical protein